MPNGMAKGYIHTGSVHRAGKQRQTRPALGRRAVVLVALMALVAGTRGAYAQGPLPGRGPGAQGAHVDKKLSDQIDKGKDTDLLRAIMRTRPGARGGLLNAVRAQRGRVSHDFALIEAFAGELPVGLLRALQRHQDVLALSVDGDVTSFAVTTPVGTTYTVTNTNNSGAGSLRQAITDANAKAGADTIWFNISGTGVQTITVTSALPSITGPTVLDATSQPGFAWTPRIRLDGTGVTGASGLVLTSTADGSVIRGLMITRFNLDGIRIQSGADDIMIAGNWIGTAGTGTTATGNGDDGIDVAGARTTIGGTGPYDRNVITNNSDEGITIVGSGVTGHVIRGNYIGLDPDGATGGGNVDVGLAIISGSGNTIGARPPRRATSSPKTTREWRSTRRTTSCRATTSAPTPGARSIAATAWAMVFSFRESRSSSAAPPSPPPPSPSPKVTAKRIACDP